MLSFIYRSADILYTWTDANENAANNKHHEGLWKYHNPSRKEDKITTAIPNNSSAKTIWDKTANQQGNQHSDPVTWLSDR